MQDLILFTSSIAMTIIYNKIKYYPCVSCTYTCLDAMPSDKPIITFTSGGGYWTYYLGIAKFIQETYEIEKKDINYLGTSAGVVSCAVLVNRIPADTVMKLCDEHLRIINTCKMGVFGNWCANAQHIYENTFRDNKIKLADNERLFSGVSKITMQGLKKQYLCTQVSYEDITTIINASCWIPFITAPFSQPVCKINDDMFLDGFFSGNDKIKNALIIYPWYFERMSLYRHWLWLGKDYNRDMYRLGYDHATKYRHKLDRFFANVKNINS